MANINNIQLPDGTTYELVKRSLTKAQYDNLSTAEKNNGTLYFVTDYTEDPAPPQKISIIANSTYISQNKLNVVKSGHVVSVSGEFTTSGTQPGYGVAIFSGFPPPIKDYAVWWFANYSGTWSSNAPMELTTTGTIAKGVELQLNNRYIINSFTYITNE